MRVVICGSRTCRERAIIFWHLSAFHMFRPITTLVSGMAMGPDVIAVFWAQQNNIETEKYYAEWERYGKSAGYKRNLAMITSKPDHVIAFWDYESKGTKHTIDLARKYIIPLTIINTRYVTL